MLQAQAEHFLIPPDRFYITGAGGISGFGYLMDQGSCRRGNPAGRGIGDDQALSLPKIQTDPDDCFCILAQQFLMLFL